MPSSDVTEASSRPCAATAAVKSRSHALSPACRTRQASWLWCMAKTMAVEAQAAPSSQAIRASVAMPVPAPPSAGGTAQPSAPEAFSAATASAG